MGDNLVVIHPDFDMADFSRNSVTGSCGILAVYIGGCFDFKPVRVPGAGEAMIKGENV